MGTRIRCHVPEASNGLEGVRKQNRIRSKRFHYPDAYEANTTNSLNSIANKVHTNDLNYGYKSIEANYLEEYY